MMRVVILQPFKIFMIETIQLELKNAKGNSSRVFVMKLAELIAKEHSFICKGKIQNQSLTDTPRKKKLKRLLQNKRVAISKFSDPLLLKKRQVLDYVIEILSEPEYDLFKMHLNGNNYEYIEREKVSSLSMYFAGPRSTDF